MFRPDPMEKIVAELALQRMQILQSYIYSVETANMYTIDARQVDMIKDLLFEMTHCLKILSGNYTESDAEWLLRERVTKINKG